MPAEIWIGATMFGALLLLLAIGIPVAFSLFTVALGSLFVLEGGFSAFSLVAPTLTSSVMEFALTAVPLFILMGAIISASGMGGRLYNALAILMHGVPGALLVATTVASTIMAAVSGSSVATAGAIGGLSIKEMRRLGYSDNHSCGAVAAGGTLGILIPPSIPLIIYGIIAEQSINKLFIACIVPGLIMAASFIGYQVWLDWRSGNLKVIDPAADVRKVTLTMRLRALLDLLPMALLIWIILGSIYQGIATPTEAAALGAITSLLLAGLLYRELDGRMLVKILLESARSSAMVLMIVAAAMLFGYVMTTTAVAPILSNTVASMDVAPWIVLAAIMLFLLFLGCFMETISIIVITTPILVPIISSFGWDLIWFGVLLVINMEMALITPPVGLNLFVVQGVVRDVSIERIMAGAAPYVGIMLLVLCLVAVVPSITTLLLN
ncbi:TRAP transporter large permease [Stutzerimonas azotifigens]|uniref:TRAP transporter large permease n=1 Tax=Stutzerimonas azotifigens TaxID=291995 RepID=UPI000684DE85|nr:TRAP transporter large permease [Stutzerimonas azotifigens]